VALNELREEGEGGGGARVLGPVGEYMKYNRNKEQMVYMNSIKICDPTTESIILFNDHIL
jgi:hypothetical protein